MTHTFITRQGHKVPYTNPGVFAVLSATDKQSTKILKESAVLLMEDFSELASVALCAVLDILETRMPEQEFVTFTETL